MGAIEAYMMELDLAAYGGPGWSPRVSSLRQELGTIWGACGVSTEWAALRAVLLHRPGAELEGLNDPNAALMLAPLNIWRAQEQHDALAQTYRDAGVAVHYVDPAQTPPPNLLFVADLMFMTREGAIVGRPASSVRAGEERWVARRLADLGIPILRSIRGRGTFEGADAMWLDSRTALVGTGLRTNTKGATQVRETLDDAGAESITLGMAAGVMHLMGVLRIVDRDLALVWPGRVPYAAVQALQEHGMAVHFLPDERELDQGMALNIVALGPRRVLMPAGNPITQAFYEGLGISCMTLDVSELQNAAGGIGCMSGILQRDIVA